MTERDHASRLSGYWPSAWPAECGGPRRQKIVVSPGLDLKPGERLQATCRRTPARWPVMFVQRDPGELYLQGCSAIGERDDSHGWVWRVDPLTLETVAESPRLPSGGHNWCGAVTVHENGDLYVVNGRFVHRLSPELAVKAELALPIDNAHNGHLILSDGNLITKDIQIDPARRTWFTLLDPDLGLIDRFELPENSVGRFACDRQADRDLIYVTSPTRVYRLIYRDRTLALDADWIGNYAIPGEDQAFAWDCCLGSDSVWFQDMGENAAIRQTLSASPIGTNQPVQPSPAIAMLVRLGLGRWLSAFARRRRRDHAAPLRVFRFSTADAADRDVLMPFGDPGGWNAAPPLYDPERRILVCFDTANARVGAFRYHGVGDVRPLWQKAYRNTNQLTLFADTGELLVDDVKPLRRWDAVVVDIETGREKGRVDTGCGMSGAMWYAPGFSRDFYTSTGFGAVARIFVG